VKLFDPIAINGMMLKNRIVMSPMTTGYAGLDQLPTPRLVSYLAARAKGGVGLITLEACVVDRRHREVPQSMHFSSDDVIDRHRAITDAVHAYGAKIQPQIVHAGPDALSPQMEKIPSVGPSVITSYLTGSPSRELAADELPGIADQYASAVRRVRAAGYDGIELHAAHGYMLLGSFLSPWRNKRGDDYAGRKRDARLRLLLEVLAAIRREVGDDFPITLRISGYERTPGGRTIDDTARIAPRLVEAGVDAFHVSGGVIDRLTSMIITGSHWGPAHNLGGARAVKNAVDVPVMTVGRIHSPELAEEILQRGDADLVVMARPLLADPELPEKLRTQRRAQIRPCVSCENCIDSMESANMNCAVNGLSGREGELSLAPTATPKRVVIVGAGPGGLETARLAALRGHRVTLYEREPRLGGSLVMASMVHPENAPFLRFLLGEVARLPIEVRRGHALSPEALRALAPDAVVVATGGRVVVPKIPGDDHRHVKSGPQLRQLVRPAALELAELLALRGRRVTIVERGERLAPEVGTKRLTEHMDALDRLGVAVNTGVAYEEITANGIAIRPERGSRHEIAADTIVIAGELEADTAFFDAVKGDVAEAYTVGDCTGLGLLRKATEEASRVASAL
jgi:2,4-dienoyl-CoA reductase (NADPH2)